MIDSHPITKTSQTVRGGGRSRFLLRASQQSKSTSGKTAIASKIERPFGLVQAAVSGDVLLRSYFFAVQGDRF